MLIHSITPRCFLEEQPVLPQLTMRQFPGGMLEGEETPRGFVISRLYSTDPALYLSKDYAPGAAFSPPGNI
jgi:hypothetical protein